MFYGNWKIFFTQSTVTSGQLFMLLLKIAIGHYCFTFISIIFTTSLYYYFNLSRTKSIFCKLLSDNRFCCIFKIFKIFYLCALPMNFTLEAFCHHITDNLWYLFEVLWLHSNCWAQSLSSFSNACVFAILWTKKIMAIKRRQILSKCSLALGFFPCPFCCRHLFTASMCLFAWIRHQEDRFMMVSTFVALCCEVPFPGITKFAFKLIKFYTQSSSFRLAGKQTSARVAYSLIDAQKVTLNEPSPLCL